ncbi:putative leucine-rich repeat-containing protein DDB_G0290503 [Drosophila tropicalis]|uniref:putative leucine-rich repeat-containing protein DDB_G0290503 n=1 Tax=Drosophila tropicalis TaxID=46794 RepID=UPI0035ABF5A0
MALHVTVNGKFGSNCKRRPISILDDPERVKKDLESERRIARIQQVREKSSNLARKIRQDVAAEKQKQLSKLEQIKQQELNTWRDHVLVKKHNDFRSSMFQVGAAHRAAKVETERMAAIQKEKEEKIRKCRQRANNQKQSTKSNLHRPTGGRDREQLNVEGRATMGTQTPLPDDKENRLLAGRIHCEKQRSCKQLSPECRSPKRKRDICCRERPKCPCISSEDDEESLGEISYSSDSSLLAENPVDVVEKPRQPPSKNLQKNPTVILDVDIDSEEDVAITTKNKGMEINDRFMQSNRQFSYVVRSSPQTSPVRGSRPPRFTQISDLVKRSETTGSAQVNPVVREELPVEEIPAPAPPRSPPKSPRRTLDPQTTRSPIKLSGTGLGSPKRNSGATSQRSSKTNAGKNIPSTAKVIEPGVKRTSISGKRNSGIQPEGAVANAPGIHPPLPHAPPVATPNIPTPVMHPTPFMGMPPPHPSQLQPFMVGYPPPYAMPYPIPVPMNPNYPQPVAYQPVQPPRPNPPVPTRVSAPPATHHTTATQSSVSSTTIVMKQGQRQGSTLPSSRVQFYDHNNKYHRNYEAPAEAVQFNQHDPTQLNAMDHARIENQLRQLREQELDKLRKITDERGQKALEREQVRRDCAELTEKLDALTHQNPQLLPSDANFIPSHRYEDAAARRQDAMNEAMENMLLRPAIITCPEVASTTTTTKKSSKVNAEPLALNVGEPSSGLTGVVSSESCCSLLLDYVDDQSKQLKSDLKATQSNSYKSQKLKNLLERIEKIRIQLIEELKAGEAPSTTRSGKTAQKVIEAIREERAHILNDKARTLDERESELQQKEAILEQRLRQFYKEQKKSATEEKSGNSDGKPMEIIIKVKSDGTIKRYVPKHKGKIKAKEQPSKEKQLETANLPPPKSDQRQISIDSNSTSYRSLPTVNYTNIEPATSSAPSNKAAPLHPVIAHYVKQLLGMTRNSVQDLGVSSSDVATPTPSIVNVSRNVSSGSNADNTLVDNRRVERVQAFIEDNRSFVVELEDTLRNQQQQQQQDKETSQRAFDQIWQKHFESKQAESMKMTSKQERQEERPSGSQQTTNKKKSVSLVKEVVTNKTKLQQTQTQQQQLVSNKLKSQSSSSQESANRQMERYAQLTENCTQRIAELTDLITKVREEKQRLVEVTLTSASDGERHSTEYLELPPDQRIQTDQQQDNRQSRSRTVSNGSDGSPLTSEALPLQKNKPTAISRDSGISDSRPITAMGQVNVGDAEPLSLGSSTQNSYRRGKAPPITIRRYSPQLNADDLAHELSTIAEVDMPTQSHLAAVTPTPVPFPSFDQYARELQLDLAHMDPNQSQRLEREFNELIQVINERLGPGDYREFPSINAYLHNVTTTRIHMETDADVTLAPNELMKQLRLSNVTMQSFPNRREYMQQLLAGETSEQRELIDSASLDNDSTDSFNIEAELRQRRILKSSFRREHNQEVASSTRRESIPELNTIDPLPNESGIEPLSSDFERDLQSLGMHWPAAMRQRQRQAAALGHSTSTSNPSPEPPPSRTVRGGAQNRSAKKSKEDSIDVQNASNLGRTLNLREFLTRELLKHRAHSGNSSVESDDSLKSNFLRSVMDSLSTSPHSPGMEHGTTTIDRQKTSTPVGSFLSAHEKSKTKSNAESQQNHDNSQLFSGESGLSAVNYPDGTPPVPYERSKSAN